MSANRVVLRDTRPSDLQDMIGWFTEETEWMMWDAPWETDTYDIASVQARHDTLLARQSGLDKDAFRTHCEIETLGGVHVGWVISYPVKGMCDGVPLPDGTRAIGIDIPSLEHRNKGYGSEAIRLYLQHMALHGHDMVCLETWSGNIRMVRVAGKLGFSLCSRDVGSRLVKGERYDGLRFVKRIGHHDKRTVKTL